MRLLALALVALSFSGCTRPAGSWTFTPDVGETIEVEGDAYDIELALNATRWTATHKGNLGGPVTLRFSWSGDEALRIEGLTECRASDEARGSTGEHGTGYMSTFPAPDGCAYEYSTRTTVPASKLEWRASGWTPRDGTIRANLTLERS